MGSFIEELYFGNFEAQARGYSNDRRVVKTSNSINELEKKLTERLQGEDEDLFLDFCIDFCNAYGELMGDSDVDSFVTGFHLGARFALDTFCRDDK